MLEYGRGLRLINMLYSGTRWFTCTRLRDFTQHFILIITSLGNFAFLSIPSEDLFAKHVNTLPLQFSESRTSIFFHIANLTSSPPMDSSIRLLLVKSFWSLKLIRTVCLFLYSDWLNSCIRSLNFTGTFGLVTPWFSPSFNFLLCQPIVSPGFTQSNTLVAGLSFRDLFRLGKKEFSSCHVMSYVDNASCIGVTQCYIHKLRVVYGHLFLCMYQCKVLCEWNFHFNSHLF